MSTINATINELINLRAQAQRINISSLKKTTALMHGNQATTSRGRGVDFSEVRIYHAGDDIRHVDWRVTARTGTTHTKLFCEDRERSLYCITDLTASMQFGTRVTFKSVIAQQCTALIAWAALHAGNRVGGLILGNPCDRIIKLNSSQQHILHLLQQLHLLNSNAPQKNPSHATIKTARLNLALALQQTRKILPPGSLLFVCSDFNQWDHDVEKQFIALTQSQEVVLIFIYDILEQAMPKAGYYSISDGEHFLTFNSATATLQQAYTQSFNTKITMLKNFCIKHRLGWMALSTDMNITREFAQRKKYL